jgi:hypothetical protein
MYFVGIDIAKRFHEAAVIDERGKVIVKRIKFQNSHSGYCKLMDSIRKLDQPVEFAMEATGHYWLSLYAHLRQDNQTVRVINPLQSDALRGLFIHETKTDTIDAFIIAEVLRIGRYTNTEVLIFTLFANFAVNVFILSIWRPTSNEKSSLYLTKSFLNMKNSSPILSALLLWNF